MIQHSMLFTIVAIVTCYYQVVNMI